MHYQEVPPLGQPSGRRGIPAWLVVGVGLVLLTIAAVVVTLRNGSPTATVAESASTKATPKSPAVTAKTKAAATVAGVATRPSTTPAEIPTSSSASTSALASATTPAPTAPAATAAIGPLVTLATATLATAAPVTAAPATTTTTAVRATTTVPAQQSGPFGDLGVSVAMSRPACDGQFIAEVAAAVTPGAYANQTQISLDDHPGSSYLRTDQSCLSFNQTSGAGNAIYVVFYGPFTDLSQACSAAVDAGNGAYVKILDNSTNPATHQRCS